MGLMSTAFATTIGSVTSLSPIPIPAMECSAHLITLPSTGMPNSAIVITQLAFTEIPSHVWHDVAWDALASSTKQLYAL